MEGLPSHVTPIAWRQVRHNEHFVVSSGSIEKWGWPEPSTSKYLIVNVKPRRVLVVPEHDLPDRFDSLIVGYWTNVPDSPQGWVTIPYTIEERRD